MYNYL